MNLLALTDIAYHANMDLHTVTPTCSIVVHTTDVHTTHHANQLEYNHDNVQHCCACNNFPCVAAQEEPLATLNSGGMLQASAALNITS